MLDGIREVAGLPNTYVKLGGLGMRLIRFTFYENDQPPSSEDLAQAWRPYIETCIEAFGEPVYTFAVVLAGLLGFTGIGSWISGRFGENTRFSLVWIIPAILLVLLLTAIASPWIFTSALGLPLPWRIGTRASPKKRS